MSEGCNPCRSVMKYPQRKRERFLTGEKFTRNPCVTAWNPSSLTNFTGLRSLGDTSGDGTGAIRGAPASALVPAPPAARRRPCPQGPCRECCSWKYSALPLPRMPTDKERQPVHRG